MDLEELKRLRERNFLDHKKKKREYYLKKKLEKESNESLKKSKQQIYDYENDLNIDNFDLKIKEIIKKQKSHVDSRKDKIIQKK